MSTDAARPVAQAELAQHRGRPLGRASVVCAIGLLVGLVINGVSFAILALGGQRQTNEFSWLFAVYILPAIVLLTLALFIAAVVLGIVGYVRASAGDRRPAAAGLIIAVAVMIVYLAGAVVLGFVLAPHLAG